jgi:hypothetical protein
MPLPMNPVARCIGTAHCVRREESKNLAWFISADKKIHENVADLGICCIFVILIEPHTFQIQYEVM